MKNPSFIKKVVLLLMFLSLVLPYSSLATTKDILVGMSAAFKGATGGLGTELYRGSMAYIEHINIHGGIHGRKIVIKAYDDGYNPGPAIQNTIRLVEKDNVLLLFDYLGTPTVTRVLPLLKIYNNRKIFLFFPFTGAQPQRQAPYGEYAFNLRASYHQETEGLVDNLVAIGRKNIAVFYQADAYGRSGWSGVKSTLSKYGFKITAEATYHRGTKYSESLAQQVKILKDSGADAVISVGAYAACAAFIRDARDAGWDVPIANVSFVGSEFLINLLLESESKNKRNYTNNLLNSQVVPSYEDISLPAVKEYRRLIDKYSPFPPRELMDSMYKPLRYSFVSLEGFLNAKLLVEILKRLGPDFDKARIPAVVEGIHNLDIGIGANVTFGPQKHQGIDRVYFTTYKDGRFIPITDWNEWRK